MIDILNNFDSNHSAANLDSLNLSSIYSAAPKVFSSVFFSVKYSTTSWQFLYIEYWTSLQRNSVLMRTVPTGEFYNFWRLLMKWRWVSSCFSANLNSQIASFTFIFKTTSCSLSNKLFYILKILCPFLLQTMSAIERAFFMWSTHSNKIFPFKRSPNGHFVYLLLTFLFWRISVILPAHTFLV